MSNPRSTVAKYLAFSMLPSLCLSIPSTLRASYLYTRAGCPAGPNGPHYVTLVAGDTCQTLADRFNTSTLEIANLNFAGADCTNDFFAGRQVCIPPPCDAYTVQAGDTCQKIVDNKNISGGLSQFYYNNPGINQPSCNNLDVGSNVCLSALATSGSISPSHSPEPSSTTSTPTPTPSSLSSSAIPPTDNCTKNYTAVSGDTCDSIVSSQFNLLVVNSSTVAQAVSYFYTLNPTVHSPTCDNLNIGQVYCVEKGISTNLTGSASGA